MPLVYGSIPSYQQLAERVAHLENVVDILMRVAYVAQSQLTDEEREALGAYRDRNAVPLPPTPPPPTPVVQSSTVWERLDDDSV